MAAAPQHAALGVTELPSHHTEDMDEGVPGADDAAAGVDACRRIVRAMRACDGEMYSGWRGEVGLADGEVRARVRRLAEEVAAALSAGDGTADGAGLVVISGAGTSGRVAYLTALWANRVLARHGAPARVRYLIAGGDPALFAARELAEDDAAAAVRDLRRLELGPPRRIVYIGISCGLSATYVGAQVEHALESPLYSAIAVIGFNSASRARRTRVTGWANTFGAVLDRMLAREGEGAGAGPARCLVITPILGPEAVTGSTRLKGGSATKIILDTAVALGAARALGLPACGVHPVVDIRESEVARAFAGFESATRASYAPVDDLAHELEHTTCRAARCIHRVPIQVQALVLRREARDCRQLLRHRPLDAPPVRSLMHERHLLASDKSARHADQAMRR